MLEDQTFLRMRVRVTPPRAVPGKTVFLLSQTVLRGYFTLIMIVEMRDRIVPVDAGVAVSSLVAATAPHTPDGDAVSALIALGYKPNEASRQIAALDQEGCNSEDLIRQALKAMVR